MKTVLINIPYHTWASGTMPIVQIELEIGKDVIIKETEDRLILNLKHESVLLNRKQYQQIPQDYKMD
jgi:hypothetical protein